MFKFIGLSLDSDQRVRYLFRTQKFVMLRFVKILHQHFDEFRLTIAVLPFAKTCLIPAARRHSDVVVYLKDCIWLSSCHDPDPLTVYIES